MEKQSIAELMNLSGKTAIVTGGAAGIGFGVANRLHEAGANVVIADCDVAAASKALEVLNARRAKSATAVCANVSKEEDVKMLVAGVVVDFGAVDILVNNAGIFPSILLADMTEADFMKVIDVNLRGVFLCTKHVSEQMKKQGKGGVIINITSIDAVHPSMIGLAHYDASKHGVWGFTKNVALELAQYNIRVNALAPGGILTPGVKKIAGSALDLFSAAIPMKRLGDPDEMGRVALFLASGLSTYMTGSQVVADGGSLVG